MAELPLVKCYLKRDDKASRTESSDDGPYKGLLQLTLEVGGINLKGKMGKLYLT